MVKLQPSKIACYIALPIVVIIVILAFAYAFFRTEEPKLNGPTGLPSIEGPASPPLNE